MNKNHDEKKELEEVGQGISLRLKIIHCEKEIMKNELK